MSFFQNDILYSTTTPSLLSKSEQLTEWLHVGWTMAQEATPNVDNEHTAERAPMRTVTKLKSSDHDRKGKKNKKKRLYT